MKIYFECLGFSSTSVFVQRNEGDTPMPFGNLFNADHDPKWLDFHKYEMDYNDGITLSEEEICKEYTEQLEKHGVVINDVSKEAWLEGRYGERNKA